MMSDQQWKISAAKERDARCFEAMVRLWSGGRMFHRRGWDPRRRTHYTYFITGPGPDARQLDLSQAVAERLVRLNVVASPTDSDREYLLTPPQRRFMYEVEPPP